MKYPAFRVHAVGAVVITLGLGVLVLGTAGVGCGASLDFYDGASPDANAYQWVVHRRMGRARIVARLVASQD